MKFITDFYSITLLVRGLQELISYPLTEVNFFRDGIILKLKKEYINILVHPRFSWIFTGYFREAGLQKATGWQQALNGAILEEVNQVNQDRIIELKFTQTVINQPVSWSVWIELIGGFPNVYLTKQPDHKLVRFYRKSKASTRNLQAGQKYIPPPNLNYDCASPPEITWQDSRYSRQLEKIFSSVSPENLHLDPGKILGVEVNPEQYYLLPGIAGFENQMKDPPAVYAEISKVCLKATQGQNSSTQQTAANILQQRNKVLLKKQTSIIDPPSVKKLGEQLKVLPPDRWESITIEDKKLNKVFKKIKHLPQGTAIEKIYGLYEKMLKQQEIYRKLSEENRQLMEKINQGDQTALDLVLNVMTPSPQQQEFRIFRTTSGKKIMISKKKEHADRLTFKIAKPHDYFFHCKDAPGAHTLLILNDKKPPSKPEIEITARLAATFSSLKNSNLVPVQYTLRKYVRKPRKSPPGLVVLEREKVLMAKPLDPDELLLYQ